MSKKHNRFSKQQQQELTSRAQLDETLIKHGWLPNPMIRDLGEDIIVQIYDESRWSGLSLFIQLKSTSAIEKYILKSGGHISYKFEVKDLIHWSDASLPVILMVWDVEKRQGWWISLTDAQKSLDENVPDWIDKSTTVQVKIPLENKTDSEGLKRLRTIVADYSYPTVAKGKSLDLSVDLHIPMMTDAGKQFFEEFKAFSEHGGELTVPPEYIADLQTSDWHQKLYGGVIFSKEHPFYVKSRASNKIMQARIDVVTSTGETASIPYVEFKDVKSGTKSIQLSNEHQPIPLRFLWEI